MAKEGASRTYALADVAVAIVATDYEKAIRLLVSPEEERYKLLLRETGLWKLEEDDTMEIR